MDIPIVPLSNFGLGRRSFRSSRGSHAPPGRTGEPSTGRRETGGRAVQRERVRDARIPEPSGCSSTGELIDAETVTISSERGGWKSACQSNSLAAYSTLTSGSEGGGWKRDATGCLRTSRPASAIPSPAAYPTSRAVLRGRGSSNLPCYPAGHLRRSLPFQESRRFFEGSPPAARPPFEPTAVWKPSSWRLTPGCTARLPSSNSSTASPTA